MRYLSQAEKNYLMNLNSFFDDQGLQTFYERNCSALVDIARQAQARVNNVHPALISSVEIATSKAFLILYFSSSWYSFPEKSIGVQCR